MPTLEGWIFATVRPNAVNISHFAADEPLANTDFYGSTEIILRVIMKFMVF